jgi:hypothetical protein
MRRLHVLVAGGLLLPATPWAGRANAAGSSASSPNGAPTVTPVATFMPAPTNLAFAADQATCDKVRAGLPGTGTSSDLCLILPHQGAGVFYWDWRGNAGHPVAVGFRLYRVDGGRHDLIRETHVATPPIEGDTALASGGLVNNACYAVTAWDQTAESAATAPLCITERSPFVAPPALSRNVLPAPGPPVVGQSLPMSAGRLPAPSQLAGFKHPAEATDPKDPKPTPCNAHGGLAGGLACQALLPKGGLALAWSYGPGHIDGFRVYSVSRTMARPPSGRPEPAPASAPGPATSAPVATQTTRLDGQVATLVVLDPRPAGFANECFTVTAFSGPEESDKSAPFCVAP